MSVSVTGMVFCDTPGWKATRDRDHHVDVKSATSYQCFDANFSRFFSVVSMCTETLTVKCDWGYILNLFPWQSKPISLLP